MGWRSNVLCLALMAQSKIAAGGCRLERLDWIADQTWASCLQAEAHLFSQGISDGSNKRIVGLGWTDAYGSFFARPWLSLHLKGLAGRMVRNESRDGTAWNRTTEQAFVQLGHPLLGRVHGAFGRLPAPFGINDNAFRQTLKSRADEFWDENSRGGRLSFRFRDDLRGELGAIWAEKATIARSRAESMSLRLTKLTDLLSGTKLVASYQTRSDESQRKFGLGTLVYNDQNLTSFEWVRTTKRVQSEDFGQIFRLLHRQNTGDLAWDFQYEDIRRDSYRLSFGVHRPMSGQWPQNIEIYSSMHYERLRQAKAVNQGYLLFGLSSEFSSSFVGGDAK